MAKGSDMYSDLFYMHILHSPDHGTLLYSPPPYYIYSVSAEGRAVAEL